MVKTYAENERKLRNRTNCKLTEMKKERWINNMQENKVQTYGD